MHVRGGRIVNTMQLYVLDPLQIETSYHVLQCPKINLIYCMRTDTSFQGQKGQIFQARVLFSFFLMVETLGLLSKNVPRTTFQCVKSN